MYQLSQGWQIFLTIQAIGLIGLYIKIVLKMNELEIRMKVSENRQKSAEATENKMNDKLDDILEKISDLKAEVQNKANR